MAWNYFPEKRALVTGLLHTSQGCGSGVFVQLSTLYVNPDGINPLPKTDDRDANPFPDEVGDRFPGALRTLCIWYLCLSTISVVLMQ